MGSLDVLYSVLIQKLIAVYEEQEAQQRSAASPGNGPGSCSPEPYDSELACFQPIKGGEIEVNSSALKSIQMNAERSAIHEQEEYTSSQSNQPPFIELYDDL
ncbi:putative partitioning defective 3-like protein B [Triplophysa rosa]|uniref:Partitioning defective 3-like protein B n=1 Tax=Triplophysa rosa TaxID=992332 RepID=A0A9W8C729_TRIRA|nr:putative partitioning defective 3-like protein B [Triplophysa rosa]